MQPRRDRRGSTHDPGSSRPGDSSIHAGCVRTGKVAPRSRSAFCPSRIAKTSETATTAMSRAAARRWQRPVAGWHGPEPGPLQMPHRPRLARLAAEERPQVGRHVTRRGVPPRRRLGNRLQANGLQVAGTDRSGPERPGIFIENLVNQHPLIAPERQFAGQQVVENNSQAVNDRSGRPPGEPCPPPAPGSCRPACRRSDLPWSSRCQRRDGGPDRDRPRSAGPAWSHRTRQPPCFRSRPACLGLRVRS